MKHDEIARLMESVAPTIGDFVSKAIAPLRAENARLSSSLSAVEQRFADFSTERENDRLVFINIVKEEIAKAEAPKVDPVEIEKVVSEKVDLAVSALPVAVNGKDADPVDLDEVALRAAKLVPIPENGKDADIETIKAAVLDVVANIEKPKDGKDADPVDLDEVAVRAAKLIPMPENGKDADIEVVRSIIAEEVAKVAPENGKDVDPAEVASLLVQLMPVPVDGKSVTLDDVKPLLQEMVAALPKAENGKDADPEMILRLVEETIAKVPAGKDGENGKSVDIQDLIPVICAEVENAFAGITPPKDGEAGQDGKSVTLDDVKPLLEEMVAAIPKAENGKDADPVEIAALIVEDVAKLIPVPADGKSVTVEDVSPLIEEMVAKKLPNLFLINEDGMLVTTYSSGEVKSIGKVRGEPGVRGASVMDGTVDESGSLVLRMSDGRILQTGTVRGESGKDGEDGKEGKPGRDAHELQILPGIDESKSYIEGIVAAWRGGLIRSVRYTDPIVDGDIIAAGWKVYLRGIAEEHEEQVEDGRFIEKITVYTDGTEFKRRHKTATPIYQGVWREASFFKGDVVTWAGSSFIAQRDTSDKPETTDAWKLATKRGRDGKDGKINRPQPIIKLDPDKT